MQHSLASRFRGTLLGTTVGQILAKNTEQQTLLVPGAQSLIRFGRFEVDDWCNSFNDLTTLAYTEAIIATLPIALFYHENEIKLRRNLQIALVAGGQDNSVSRDGALAVGYAIAQSLKEKLNAATLIPQTVAFIGAQTQLSQQLLQVQILLNQQAGFERVQAEISRPVQPTTSVAIAFYCFLSTLEDLRLSIMRAVQSSYQPQLTSAITGALSGAYNSIAGMPASLHITLSRSNPKLLVEMLELSDSLVAVWSGRYHQTLSYTELTQVAAIAAPYVIRPH